MKINYRSTALDVLDGTDCEINIPEGHVPMSKEKDQEFGHSVLKALKESKDVFKKKIRFVSMPFMEAYMLGKHKLSSVFDKEDIDEAGTFIWRSGSFTFTNFYYLKTQVIDGVWTANYMFIQFSKHAQNDYKGLDVCISGFPDQEGTFTEKTFIWKGHYANGCNHSYYLAFLVGFICFMKHCPIETKLIKAKSKEKHLGTKYLNETNNNIEILDSTWFTTIVRSEGFAVRGHFRFQPKKENGVWVKKLIWISDFQKEGYTREAKILKQQPIQCR